MKNEFAPTVLAFALVVVGVSWAPVPLWFKFLVLLSGIIMMIISLAQIVGTGHAEEDSE